MRDAREDTKGENEGDAPMETEGYNDDTLYLKLGHDDDKKLTIIQCSWPQNLRTVIGGITHLRGMSFFHMSLVW